MAHFVRFGGSLQSYSVAHFVRNTHDDRYTVRSTIATSQYPLDQWCETMEAPTLADAILDRLVNNAHKIQLTGESMRKVKGQQELEKR